MERTWWDSEGNQWDTWGGMSWIIGNDPSKRVPKTPEQTAEIEKLLKEWDEEDANAPINVSAPKNILADFIDGLVLDLALQDMFERATGKKVEFGKQNLQFPEEM